MIITQWKLISTSEIVPYRLSLSSGMGMLICRSMLLSSSSGAVSMIVSLDRSQNTSSRDRLPLLLLDAAELRDRAGVVGTDETGVLTSVLEFRDDKGIGMMLHPPPVELDAAGDAGRGGVGGPPTQLAGAGGSGATVMPHMFAWDSGASLGRCADSCPPWWYWCWPRLFLALVLAG